MPNSAVRVLLVDDDEDEHVIVGDLLRLAGSVRFDLTWVQTYEQGLQAARSGSFDVCLIDYRLGQHNGLDLLKEITAQPGCPQVILLTGEGDHGVDVTATQAGAADYLLKGGLTAALLERSIRFAVERGRTLSALRVASELAHSSNLAKSAFLAAMSHEIRTPMHAILGMAELLAESSLNPEQRQYVEVFQRAGSGLLTLINDILDLSKIEAGHLDLERVEFDLEEVIDQVIELTAVKARAKGLVVLSHIAPGVATCLAGDPGRLKQVFTNLLGNAVKFTSTGEVVLRVAKHESGEAGQLEFAVSDTGIGIPADKLDTIFEDFTQADSSVTRRYGGTGLGLGISRRLVAAMGGSLTATSKAGQGSTFRFVAGFGIAGPAAAEHPGLAAQRGKRVMLVDSNYSSSFILREMFEAWGLTCDEFRSPREALVRLRESTKGRYPYSLVVLDCMTEAAGMELVSGIRDQLADVPILLLASEGGDGSARRAEAGLLGFAVLPVARRRVCQMVCAALQHGTVPPGPPPLPVAPPAKFAARPARILVAEDSPDNQLLMQAYLKDQPYLVTFVGNGEIALDRFSRGEFDLILMDVQMPVMDGLEATRAIRGLERKRDVPATPILAVTAGASPEEVEQSLRAGCNAQLSKPLPRHALLEAIEKYRQPAKPHMAEELQPASPEFDPIWIEAPKGLEELLPGYLASRRLEVPEMLALLAQSDFRRLSNLAHNLKGTGIGYGFAELARQGAMLEHFAKEKNASALRTQVTELGNYLEQVQLVAKT